MIPTDNLLLFLLVGAILIIIMIIFRSKRKPKHFNSPPFQNHTSIPSLTETKRTSAQTIPEPQPVILGITDAFEDDIPLTLDVNQPLPEFNAIPTDDFKAEELLRKFGPYDHKLELASYKYPSVDLLQVGTSNLSITSASLDASKQKIVSTLELFQVRVEKIKANIGPTLTRYEVTPAPGIRIAKIKRLENDIALSLAATGTRVTGQIPGTGAIGIEVPHPKSDAVYMRPLIESEKFQLSNMELPIILGRTMTNEVYITDLTKMPHLLISGATGQGKSVSISAMLISLLYKKHPAELKFVLIDINKLELSLFKKIEHHFLAKLPAESNAIVTSLSQVNSTLQALSIEIDQRYDLLQSGAVRSITEYNEKFIKRKIPVPERHRYLPYIVVVIDEFAELIPKSDQTAETLIARIAQLGRPVGVHLIISTQRPSVNIITGTIKANFPTRLAFRVFSSVDSKTIIDNAGAEELNGRGDMLFSSGTSCIRLQGAFVNAGEIVEICTFISNQRGYPTAMWLPEYYPPGWISPVTEYDPDDRDPMFEEAARLIVLHQQGSTSLIQRKMKLGYNRAGRIIDQLEAAGIVGSFDGSKARKVLYPDGYSLERYLDTLVKSRR